MQRNIPLWHKEETLSSLFFKQAARYLDRPLFYKRNDQKWHAISWREAEEQVKILAHFLQSCSVSEGDTVIIAAENRPEWAIAELALMSIGAIAVPAYTSYQKEDYLYLTRHSKAVGAILSAKTAERFLSISHPGLRFALMMEEAEKIPPSKKISIFPWPEKKWPEKKLPEKKLPEKKLLPPLTLHNTHADDVCCLIYTSGSSGDPKGVMLTHRSILSNIASIHHILKDTPIKHYIFLSLLPLSHAYEHMAGLHLPISLGGAIYYCESSDTVARDLAEARPTLMTAVPRLYEVLHNKILAGIRKKGGISAKIFFYALKIGLKKIKGQKLTLFPDLFFGVPASLLIRKKINKRFGGRLHYFISGGAALSPEIGNFFTALGVGILQGYGQTEASPLISVNLPNHIRMDTVGPAIKGLEVMLSDEGELLVKGDAVMKGYWRDEKTTKETLKDGWLHTGDLAEIDETGFITIIGRRKEIIVLSDGHTISPTRVENALSSYSTIAQVMVHGDEKPWLSAIITPEESATKAEIETEIKAANTRLPPHEKIRRFILTDQAFSIENSQMTPTLKLRRHKIYEAYQKKLNALYSSKA